MKITQHTTTQYFSTLCLVALLLLGACTGKSTDQSQRIKMRLPSEPPTLDWTLATDNISKEVILNIQAGLVGHDSKTKVEPALAEKWDVSSDLTEYTFHLRKDAVWSDGVPLEASHFVDSWERVLNPTTGSEYAYFLFDVLNAESYQKGDISDFSQVGIQAKDKHTVVVKLKGPVSYWLHIPTFWITFPIRKDVIAKHGDKWTRPENMVSIGAWKLKEHKRDSRILLVKNDKFYEKNPGLIPELEFRIVKDDSVAVSLFDTGDLDIVRNLPPSQLKALSTRPEFKQSPYLRMTYFGFNINDKHVSDPRIRRALVMAIDRNELVQLLAPSVSAAKSWIPLDLDGSDKNVGIDTNIAEAKKLWDSIENKPDVIPLWFDQNEKYKLVAENLQAQWKRNLGLNTELSSQEWKVYLKQLDTEAPAIWRLGWGADYPDPDTFMGMFKCRSGNNETGFCSDEFDNLVTKASQIAEMSERTKLYTRAQEIFLEEEIAMIPLFQEQSLHLVSQRVDGFNVDLIGDFLFKRLRLK